jgi:hypothetical protein
MRLLATGLAAAAFLAAQDPTSGKIVWQTPPTPPCTGKRGCSAAQLAPSTAVPGLVFSA